MAARAQNTAAADLLKRITALMDDFKGGGAAVAGNLSSADGKHLDKLLDLLQTFAHMEHTADEGLRLQDVIQLGVPSGLWQLLGISVDAINELGGLEEFLASREDVVVVRKEHYEQLIKLAKKWAAINAQHLHDTSGDAAIIDRNVPLPLYLILDSANAAGTKFKGDDPRILAKLMAEQRQEYLLGLRPREGERRVCRCGQSFTDSRDARNHIMKAGFNKFGANLREEMGVGSRKRGEAKETSVFVSDGIDDLLGRASQTGVDDFMAGITQRPRHHLGSTVMPVETRFGNNDPQGLVHETPRASLL